MQIPRLTRYELELMDVLWQRGEATVQEVCDVIKRPLAYTTVMTTLSLLHSKKKVLTRTKRGRAHVYKPAITREDVSGAVVRDLKEVLFADQLPAVMLGLLGDTDVSKDDIKALKAAIRKLEDKQ